jgi:catechol 2,3-dioxygenase
MNPATAAEKAAASAARLPDEAHVGRVQLRVADLERSLGFYRDLLGMRIIKEEAGVITLAAGGSELKGNTPPREIVALREVVDIARRSSRPSATGLYHVAFLVPDRSALGQAILGLYAANYPLRGMSDHAVSESLYLDDPDGNGLEIYADRPRSQWRFQNGEIYMTTEPMDVDGVVAAARERVTPWRGLPPETIVGHVHFTVSNLERSVAFYRDVIGFDVMLRWPTLAAVSAGGYHHHLNLNTWAGPEAPPDTDNVAGLDYWELKIPEEDANTALTGRIRASGVVTEQGNGAIQARDPDGIAVQIAGGQTLSG